jgi:hypothetical protein
LALTSNYKLKGSAYNNLAVGCWLAKKHAMANKESMSAEEVEEATSAAENCVNLFKKSLELLEGILNRNRD